MYILVCDRDARFLQVKLLRFTLFWNENAIAMMFFMAIQLLKCNLIHISFYNRLLCLD